MKEAKLPRDTSVLISMRDEGMTLQQIANVYSVSREAIRRRIGNTGRSTPFKDTVNKIACMDTVPLNLSDRVRNAVSAILKRRIGTMKTKNSGAKVYVGEQGELLVSAKLHQLGIGHKLAPRKYYCDIILDNGKTIDVKSTRIKKHSPSMRGAGDYYSFGGARKNKERLADYFIFVIPQKLAFFVVPQDKVIGFDTVVFTYPKTNCNGRVKVHWQHYQDRFDLLK